MILKRAKTPIRDCQMVEHESAVAAEVEKFVERLIAGKTDRASARCDLGDALQQKGLSDLSWDADWLDTVLDLNVSLYFGWRYYMDRQQKPLLDEWPAQELIRVGARKRPRDWLMRWQMAGGTLSEGERMVARMDDDVWDRLGDPGIFADGVGYPYPPFAANSGMGVKAITRDEAMCLGIIDRDSHIEPRMVSKPTLILLDPARQEQ